jgi:hypothetical protein
MCNHLTSSGINFNILQAHTLSAVLSQQISSKMLRTRLAPFFGSNAIYQAYHMRAHGATGTCGWAEKFLGLDLESSVFGSRSLAI